MNLGNAPIRLVNPRRTVPILRAKAPGHENTDNAAGLVGQGVATGAAPRAPARTDNRVN